MSSSIPGVVAWPAICLVAAVVAFRLMLLRDTVVDQLVNRLFVWGLLSLLLYRCAMTPASASPAHQLVLGCTVMSSMCLQGVVRVWAADVQLGAVWRRHRVCCDRRRVHRRDPAGGRIGSARGEARRPDAGRGRPGGVDRVRTPAADEHLAVGPYVPTGVAVRRHRPGGKAGVRAMIWAAAGSHRRGHRDRAAARPDERVDASTRLMRMTVEIQDALSQLGR
ncbi:MULTISPECIES: hypothetical protein [Nocardia]|uniref:hypothetical protein n=1 Tax=Nocardia TaxID=1817 RepID=UPI001358E9E8|nr:MULTISPECIES: hypothetical protein [Nocardia]